MFDDAVLKEVARVARTHRIELAALLAVVEIESDGRALEVDGKTPQFLFEKHIFYRQLHALAPTKVQIAVAEGLAYESWQPKTEYKNEATSSMRLALFARAKEIHAEAAYRSASWGVGQTMGFCFKELGFVDATHMVEYMISGGVGAQVECMVREIESKHISQRLNTHDWAGFALAYNGAGYRQNHYDSKLAVAYARWKPKAAAIAAAESGTAPDPQAQTQTLKPMSTEAATQIMLTAGATSIIPTTSGVAPGKIAVVTPPKAVQPPPLKPPPQPTLFGWLGGLFSRA